MLNKVNENNQTIHKQLKEQRFATYPYTVIEADKKLYAAQKKILQILLNLQSHHNYLTKQEKVKNIHPSIPLYNNQKIQAQQLQRWLAQDELDNKIKTYIQQNANFYESKLAQQTTRYFEMKDQYKKTISQKQQQIKNLKQNIAQLKKEEDRYKSRIKKLQSQNQEGKNIRKNQKQRIVAMLMQQKQDIFLKYTQLQKQNIVLLEFVHKAQDIIQKKFYFDGKQDDITKIPYITEIQLEASKYYSILKNPMLQEILNEFTQTFNILNKKYEKFTQFKLSKLQRSSDKKQHKQHKDSIFKLKSKPVQSNKRITDFQIMRLKQQKQKITKAYEQKLKQSQNLLNFQRDKTNSLRKKLEKHQQQLQKRNKQLLAFHQKQMDTQSKMKWLEEELLDYERKLKMHRQELEFIQDQRSTSECFKKDVVDQNQLRNKSKSLLLKPQPQIAKPKPKTNQLKDVIPSLQVLQAQQIKHLKQSILTLNKIQLQNQQQIRTNKKTIQQLQIKYNTQKQIKQTKQKDLWQNLQLIHEKQKVINNLNIQLKVLSQISDNKTIQINSIDRQMEICEQRLQENSQKMRVLLKFLGKIQQLTSIQDINVKIQQPEYQQCLLQIIPQIQRNISQLKQNYQQASSKFVQDQSKISQLQKQIATYGKQLQNRKKKQHLLQQQIQNILKSRTQSRLSHQKQIQTLKLKANLFESQIKEIQNQKQIALKQLKVQIQRNQANLKMYANDIEKRQSVNNILAKQNQQLLKQISKRSAQSQKIEQEINQLKNKQETIAHEVLLLKFQNQKLKQVSKQQSITNQRIHQISIQYQKLNSILIEKDKIIGDLNQKCKILNQNILLSNNKLNQKQKQFQEIKSKLQQNAIIIQQKQQKLKEQQLKCKQSQQKYNSLILKIQQQHEQIYRLQQALQQMQDKMAESLLKRPEYSKNESEIEENLSQSKQLSFMHSQIKGFKQQLNQLLKTIQQKDKQILILKCEIQSIYKNRFNDIHENQSQQQYSSSMEEKNTILQKNQGNNKNQLKQQMVKIIKQQQNQINKLKIQQTKHQILATKVIQLQTTLHKEKQIYFKQITKNNIRIFQLQGQIRHLKQQFSAKKRKLMSQEYFSIDPFSSKQSKDKSNQHYYRSNNLKAARSRKESGDDFQGQIYHSLQQDFQEEVVNRNKQELQLENKVTSKSRLRREKSQQQRTPIGIFKIQKQSSMEKHHDSQQKSRQQKKDTHVSIPLKLNEQSPKSNNIHEIKYNNLSKAQLIKSSNVNINDEPPLITSSENSLLNQAIKNLTQENRSLKHVNDKLTKDLKQMSQIIQIFDKGWKKQKQLQNNSQSGKLISLHKLQQNFKLLESNKNKILQESNQNEKVAIFQNIFNLISQAKRWIQLIQRLTNQNKRISLEIAISKFPKLIKTKTLKLSQYQQCRRRSRTVYSEGNVYHQNHIDVDDQMMHDEQNPPHNLNQAPVAHVQTPTNSLQILFKQNQQMSEISSVKHKSYNSGFLNSRSQIAKIFQKGEKHDKDHKQTKKQDHKKDVVDQYAFTNQKVERLERFDKIKNMNMNSNMAMNAAQPATNSHVGKSFQNKLPNSFVQSSPLMQKSSCNYYQQNSHIDLLQHRKYQDRSAKANRRLIFKNLTKMASINSKINENKKQYSQVIKNIIQKYEDKIANLQLQFSQTVRKLMLNSVTLQEHKKCLNESDRPNDTRNYKKPVLSGRISQKDEQIQERVQQMETIIQKQKKQVQNKDKTLQQLQNQIKQYDKKIKQQKLNHQNFKTKYLAELANSSNLKYRVQKINLDFECFISKVIKQRQNKQNYSTKTIQIQAGLQIQSLIQPINSDNTKKFLKSKKPIKTENSQSIETIKDKEASMINLQQKGTILPQNQLVQKRQSTIKDLKKNQQSTQVITQQKQKINQKPIKIQNKQQIPVILDRSKSQNVQLNRRKQQKRESDKSQNQGKSLSISAIITNMLNPNTSLTKKKTISEASISQQLIYYQNKLKQIHEQLQNILSSQSFKYMPILSQKSIQSQEQIFINKKERQSRIRSQVDFQNQRQRRQRQKQKQKLKQKKIKDEQQIMNNLKILNDEINNYKKQVAKANNQWQQRLKQIIKSLIDTFKISRKSVQKIIDLSQKKDHSLAKYINSRIFFKKVYNQLNIKQSKDTKDSLTKSNKMTGSDQFGDFVNKMNKQGIVLEPSNDYQSFQEKYIELQKSCDKLKEQLLAKNLQLQAIKREGIGSNLQNKKYNSRQQSFTSNQNDQHFEDFQNKQLFDNTKPTFEFVEQLKLQNEYLKKKCQQYEIMLNKKRSDKLKYIRKW